MIEFVMPILGADMEAGTLVEWRRQPGERVERGEVIAEVETEKGLIEVEVFTSGVIEKILVAPGEKVPVGTVMALIREDPGTAAITIGAPPPAVGAVSMSVGAPPEVPTSGGVPRGPAPDATAARGRETKRVRASPAARRRAADLGVDLAAVRGTGPDGAIGIADVERAAPSARAEPAVAAPASRADAMRRTIAAAMARSKREIPHYYLATTIDVQRALSWLETRNAARPVSERVLSGALLLKAVALALREVPELNGVWTGTAAALAADVHLGVAIALRGGGLVAPALHHADRLDIDELMRRFRDLVARARTGSLRSSELSEPTITVTSLGEQGVESVFGVIYPPQLAIVGFGKIVERPRSVDGAVVSRPVVTATLSADHRVSDGHRGARFLAAVDRLLQEPEGL
jgi:pyruvate dehydrogenase E2 component (dihydrolipoamide acetyltransferase)